MSNKEQTKADKEIQVKLQEAKKLLDEAAEIARKHNVWFHWDGPTYGMGGSFDPEYTEDDYGDETNGWRASSHSC